MIVVTLKVNTKVQVGVCRPKISAEVDVSGGRCADVEQHVCGSTLCSQTTCCSSSMLNPSLVIAGRRLLTVA